MGGVSGGVHISLRAFVRSVARRQGGSAWEGAMASHALVASHATAAALLGCFRLDDRFAGPIRSDFPDLFA